MNGLQEWNMKVKITKKSKMRIILKVIRKTRNILTENIMKVKIKIKI